MNHHTCLECWRDASDSGAQGRCGCDCGRSCRRPGTTTAVIVRGNSDGSRCEEPIATPPWDWIERIPARTWLATALAIAAGVVFGAMAAGFIAGHIMRAVS